MKKLLVVFTILVLASCTQSKIAYVDYQNIIKEYDGSKKAEEEMKAKSAQMKSDLDQLAKGFQQKVQEYQANSKNLSDKDKREKEQVLMQEQQMIQRRQQMAQQQVQSEGQNIMDKLNKEIDSFLADYAKKKGYNLILGTSDQTKSVLYGDASLNITEDVVSSLNENYKPEDNIDKNENAVKKDTVN